MTTGQDFYNELLKFINYTNTEKVGMIGVPERFAIWIGALDNNAPEMHNHHKPVAYIIESGFSVGVTTPTDTSPKQIDFLTEEVYMQHDYWNTHITLDDGGYLFYEHIQTLPSGLQNNLPSGLYEFVSEYYVDPDRWFYSAEFSPTSSANSGNVVFCMMRIDDGIYSS